MFKFDSRKPHVIEPNKCIIEDLEILAFETSEQLNLFTVWHEALADKRRELNASSERERQIIRDEIARKTKQLIGSVDDGTTNRSDALSKAAKSKSKSSKRATSFKTSKISENQTKLPSPSSSVPAVNNALRQQQLSTSPNRRVAATLANNALLVSRRNIANAVFRPSWASNQSTFSSHQRQGAVFPPKGLQVFNSAQVSSSVNAKQGMRYKLTKLYNKYRGRQTRRNFVLDKQRNARIELEIGKSYINPWMAYTALQALRLPDSNVNTLSTTTSNASKILTPLTQPITSTPPSAVPNQKSTSKKGKAAAKKQAIQAQQTPMKGAPMHLVYIDPVNLITYSNRINPQQVAEYRQKSHLLPSSATSKKSSAASYDVYEIMEVLANTNKTNVTITRNANRPFSAGSNSSVYSHSVNSNTPGIVSTQLHLQAKSYLDSMSKFYAEEAERLAKEQEKLEQEPSHEEMISRYLDVDRFANVDKSVKSTESVESFGDASEDELEKLEEDIRFILEPSDQNFRTDIFVVQ